MQLRRLVFLGLLLGADAAQLVRRQSSAGGTSPTDGNANTSPSSPAQGTTASSPANNSPTGGSSGGGGSTNNGDSTITKTTTVTDDSVGTASQQTTVMTTITSTILVTVTEFETTTVTSRGADTATKTVYETSTQWANQKRAIDLAPRTVGPEDMVVEAAATDAPAPTVTQVNFREIELIRHKRAKRGHVEKRATITEFVTVTVGKDSKKTVVNTATRTVISTVSSETKITSTVTETEQADAKTTVTVTSTLTVTSTAVTTGVVVTATIAPTGSYGSAGSGGTSAPDSSSTKKADSGLGTGAKAGIGAGCGVVGLALIAGLLWFCLKRRRSPKVESDDMFGSSEVPVGSSYGRSTPPPVSQHNRDTAAAIVAPRRMPTKPNSPEGYRGTARGDGRAGFAKPDAFGSAYTAVSPETAYSRTTAGDVSHPSDVAEMQSPANTAELSTDGHGGRWHESNAAEIDGNQVSRAHNGAQGHVYEMPTEHYK